MTPGPRNLIRPEMLVRDIRNRHPRTQKVFERFGVRTACWDCSLAEVAERNRIGVEELLTALNELATTTDQAGNEE